MKLVQNFMLFLPVALASSLGAEGVHICAGTITVTSPELLYVHQKAEPYYFPAALFIVDRAEVDRNELTARPSPFGFRAS